MSSPEREALHGFGRHERGHGLPLSAFRHVGPCRGFHGVAHEVGVDPDVAHGRADAGMAEQLGHQQYVAAGAVVGEGGEPTPQAVAGERCGLLDAGTDVIPQAWPSKRPGTIQSPPRRRIARASSPGTGNTRSLMPLPWTSRRISSGLSSMSVAMLICAISKRRRPIHAPNITASTASSSCDLRSSLMACSGQISPPLCVSANWRPQYGHYFSAV